jgi:hypothetical protein
MLKGKLENIFYLIFNVIWGHDQLLEIRLLKKSARHDFIIARQHRAIIIFLVNWWTAVLNLLSCRINWI